MKLPYKKMDKADKSRNELAEGDIEVFFGGLFTKKTMDNIFSNKKMHFCRSTTK